MKTLHVIVTVYIDWLPLLDLINLFKRQSNPGWLMTVAHDGPAPGELRTFMNNQTDHRITFYEHPKNLGSWGFPLRRLMLQKLLADPNDFVLITNHDNMYVPVFVEYMMKETVPDVGIVFCDTIHSHQQYNILTTDLKVSSVDMGSGIVRVDVAKAIGIRHDVYYADGLYFEECDYYCAEHQLRHVKISKPLFIHC